MSERNPGSDQRHHKADQLADSVDDLNDCEQQCTADKAMTNSEIENLECRVFQLGENGAKGTHRSDKQIDYAADSMVAGITQMEKNLSKIIDSTGASSDEGAERFQGHAGEYEFKIFQDSAGGGDLHDCAVDDRIAGIAAHEEKSCGKGIDPMGEGAERFQVHPGEYEFKIYQDSVGSSTRHPTGLTRH